MLHPICTQNSHREVACCSEPSRQGFSIGNGRAHGYKALPEKMDQNHRSVATPGPVLHLLHRKTPDFEVTPLRPTIAFQDHLSKSRLPSIRPDWSRVMTAASRDASEAREAVSSLCQAYSYPIYAYIRHRGYAPEQPRGPDPGFGPPCLWYTLEPAHELTPECILIGPGL